MVSPLLVELYRQAKLVVVLPHSLSLILNRSLRQKTTIQACKKFLGELETHFFVLLVSTYTTPNTSQLTIKHFWQVGRV